MKNRMKIKPPDKWLVIWEKSEDRKIATHWNISFLHRLNHERSSTMNKAPIEHEELRAAIADLGGQKAVATRFGIPYRTVQNWYRGERTPPEYVARMLVQYNEDEIHHLTTEMYNQDTISELRRSNKDLMERDKADTKRYIEDQEALRWYNNELNKAKELAENRLREVEALDMEVCELWEMVEALTNQLEKEKKAREVWARQAGMLTK